MKFLRQNRPKQLKLNRYFFGFLACFLAITFGIIIGLKTTSSAIAVGMQYTSCLWLFLLAKPKKADLHPRRTWPMLLLLAGKFVFTMICFCSGAPGGIFFPLLVLGALTGGIVGSGAVALLGLPEGVLLNFLLLGMVGMFSGIVRAPVTGIILVAEMSGSLTQFTGLVLVSAVAALTANLLGSKPIYDELLENMLHNRSSSR